MTNIIMTSIQCGVLIIDIYFLRRYLDKDYVTHGITYTGGNHSDNYVRLLTKYVDFKVTHASYARIPLDKVNKILKNASHDETFDYFTPDKEIQCSSMKDFPDNFKE